MISVSAYQRSWLRHGFVVIPDLIGEDMCYSICADLADGELPWVSKEGISSGKTQSRYSVLDGISVSEYFPELIGAYHAIRPLAELVVGANLRTSPWPRSAVNVKRYSPGDTQGAHWDSNPVTVLLYLNTTEGATVIRGEDGIERSVHGEATCGLLLAGKAREHWVEGVTGVVRYTVPMNYYTDDDCDRPDWLDEAIYENLSIGEHPERL